MSEATGRQEMERRLIERSLEDEDFRRRLLEDPGTAVEQELGAPLPEGVEVRAVEETADTIFLVLPPASAGQPDAGLSDRELEAVAGGGWGDTYTCAQGGNTCNYSCNCAPG